MTDTLRPTVVIDWFTHQKIMRWVCASDYEVSGLGKVKTENGVVRVVDAILLPQKNTFGSTDIEAEDVAKAMFLTKDMPGELRFWWHSHGNGSVFWSSTDEATMKKLGSQGWFLATVFNRKWESRTAIYMGKPFTVSIDELKLEIGSPPLDTKMTKAWDDDYKAKVKNIASTAPATAHGRWNELYPGADVEKNMTKKQLRRLRRLREEHFSSARTPHGPPPCVMCGLSYSCNCNLEAKKVAEAFEEAGYCWECELDKKACTCDETQDEPTTQTQGATQGEIAKRRAAKKGPPASANGNTNGTY